MRDCPCCRRRLLEVALFLTASYVLSIVSRWKPSSAFQQFSVREERAATTATLQGRHFDVYNYSLPCDVIEPVEKYSTLLQPTPDGLFFLKPYKVGSSTASGVHLRVARNIARRRNESLLGDSLEPQICKARFSHGKTLSPAAYLFHNRSKTQSFLWSLLRDPTNRKISEFFHFQVSREHVPPTDDNFLHHIRTSKRAADYYLQALSLTPGFDRTRDDPIATANAILADYDFIAITERMDESLVVMSMLMRIPVSDFLHLSAKTNGNYDALKPCIYITPKFVSPGMQDFFQSEEWRDYIQHDLVLYQAVNRSLDLTIEHLGREAFEQRLYVFRAMQQMVKELCLPTAVFPCDSEGNYHEENNCMWKDSGCNMDCLDRVAAQFQDQ